MKRIGLLFAIIAGAILLLPSSVFCGVLYKDWNKLNQQERVLYLSGYIAGNYEMLRALSEHLPDSPFEDAKDLIEKIITNLEEKDRYTITQVMENIDYLYEQPENVPLPLFFILRASTLKMDGEEDSVIEQYLEQKREKFKIWDGIPNPRDEE